MRLDGDRSATTAVLAALLLVVVTTSGVFSFAPPLNDRSMIPTRIQQLRLPPQFHSPRLKNSESARPMSARREETARNANTSTKSSYRSERKESRADVLRPLKILLWPLIRLVTFIQRLVFRVTVRSVAGFLTAVLIDPGVNKAAATAIRDGINMWFTQRNVKQKLAALQRNLSEQDPALAKDIGKDFPKVLFDFVVGLVLQGFDEEIGSGEDVLDEYKELDVQ